MTQTTTPAQTEIIRAFTERLARQVIPAHSLDGFLAMPLRSQVVGLAVMARLGGEDDVMRLALQAVDVLDGKAAA